jgi:hypothetical protein
MSTIKKFFGFVHKKPKIQSIRSKIHTHKIKNRKNGQKSAQINQIRWRGRPPWGHLRRPRSGPPTARLGPDPATSGEIWARSGHLRRARSWPPPARSGPDPARPGPDPARSVAGLQRCHLHRRASTVVGPPRRRMTTVRVAEGGGVRCGRWEVGCVEVGERPTAARCVGVRREAGSGGVGGGEWEARVSPHRKQLL